MSTPQSEDAHGFDRREICRLALLAEYLGADREGRHADWRAVSADCGIDEIEGRRLVGQLGEARLLGGRVERNEGYISVFNVRGITLAGERALRRGLEELEQTAATSEARASVGQILQSLSAGTTIVRLILDLAGSL